MVTISEEYSTKPKRILIVDDETAILFAYQKLFRIFGVIIDVCETFEHAIELIKNNIYEIVLTDIRLTHADGKEGLEILRYIKNHHSETEVIVMTGYGNEAIKKEAIALGVSYYFEKPVSPDVIIEILRKLGVERNVPLKVRNRPE